MPQRSVGYHYLKFVTPAVLCVAGMGAIGYVPTLRLGGSTATTAMLAALGISLAASLMSAAPIAFALACAKDKVALAALLGMTTRFLVVLAMVAVLALTNQVAAKPLVVWVVISYLVLLVVDTIVSVLGVQRSQETTE